MQEDEVIYEAVEETPVIEESSPEVVDVEIFEAFQAPTAGDEFNHALLTNREIHDAHPITAITGLREELDSIEALQTVYSDKKGNADYYEWADGLALGENGVGYFVTLNRDIRTISICTGDDIFGVVVPDAAFVGGQDAVARDVHYGLVATSGAVHVMCELDVIEGDYVVANEHGKATKSTSGRGYKVVAQHDINGVPHAAINLSITADQVDLMGAELQSLDSRMGAAETNIVSAINVANEAYKKSQEATTSSSVSEEAVKEALESILNSENKIKEFEQTIETTSVISSQAKAIAESAATSAASMREEAVKRGDNDWKDVNDLINTLEPIATWVDEETGATGADYLVTQMEDGIATTTDIKTVDGKTDKAISAINRNAKELQSLMTVIDKYSVGEYSQAYGLTLEQAQGILEPGMIYVPTSHEGLEAGTKHHTEVYQNDTEAPTSPRTFIPWYLYQWGKIGDHYGWITVDKNNDPIKYDETAEENKTNTAGCAVYFTSEMVPNIAANPQYGYWYTDGDTSTGAAKDYESYTLYKWEEPEDEDGYWFAVATLAGNVGNRATSQVRQTTNEIEAVLTNKCGSVSSFGTWLTNTEAAVQSLASWRRGDKTEESNNAIIKQIADENGSSIVISTYTHTDDGTEDGSITNQASLTLNTATVDGENSLVINAKNIVLEGSTTFITKDGDETKIDGAHIATGTVTAGKLSADALQSNNYNPGEEDEVDSENPLIPSSGYAKTGTFFNLSNGAIYAPYFYLSPSGKVNAASGKIGNWSLEDGILYYGGTNIGYTGINASVEHSVSSLISGESNIRFFAGSKTYTGFYSDEANRPKFLVLADGSLYAGAAEISGAITAKSGRIGATAEGTGGWNISTQSISSDNDTTLLYSGAEEIYKRISLVDNNTRSPVRFCSGYNQTTTNTVTETEHDVGATAGTTFEYSPENCQEITEVVSCKVVSGNGSTTHTIDGKTLIVKYTGTPGATIETIYTYTVTDPVNYASFSVLEDGSLYASAANISGTVNARNGKIGGWDISSGALENYSGTLSVRGGNTFYANSFCMQTAGNGALNALAIGECSPNDWSSAAFKVTVDGTLHASKANITGGTVQITDTDGSLIRLGDVLGLTMFGSEDLFKHQSFTVHSTTMLQFGYNDLETNTQYTPNSIMFFKGIDSPNDSYAKLVGTWKLNDASISTASDRTLKHDITPLGDDYAKLFDMLQPVKFKYNNGTSNRYHTGFIAQDVCTATENVGLTTNDFAAYVEFTNEDGSGKECGLRYEEFIALCVSEIQKLKKRMAELENISRSQND